MKLDGVRGFENQGWMCRSDHLGRTLQNNGAGEQAVHVLIPSSSIHLKQMRKASIFYTEWCGWNVLPRQVVKADEIFRRHLYMYMSRQGMEGCGLCEVDGIG